MLVRVYVCEQEINRNKFTDYLIRLRQLTDYTDKIRSNLMFERFIETELRRFYTFTFRMDDEMKLVCRNGHVTDGRFNKLLKLKKCLIALNDTSIQKALPAPKNGVITASDLRTGHRQKPLNGFSITRNY